MDRSVVNIIQYGMGESTDQQGTHQVLRIQGNMMTRGPMEQLFMDHE